MVMCRGARCREICQYARRWCAACWAALSDIRRGNIERCVAFLAEHPGDRAASTCLRAAISDADRDLAQRVVPTVPALAPAERRAP